MKLFSRDWWLFGKVFTPDQFTKSSVNKTFWNPVGSIDYVQIEKDLAHLKWHIEQLKLHPKRLKRVMNSSFVLGIIFGVASLLYTMVPELGFIVGFVFLLPFFAIKGLLHTVKVDIIKHEIAKENNWLYDPSRTRSQGGILCKKFPEVLLSGNCHEQHVEDRFWGDCTIGTTTYPFHSGLYSYANESGSGKNRRKTTYHRYYFCFKLPRTLQSQFLLYPETVLSRLFSSKEINVESIAFNKAFAFAYNGKKGEQAQHIVRSLSPSVQEKLVKLSKLKKGLRVLFKNDTVLFAFNGKLLHKPKSKILGGIDLSQSDVDEVNYYLKEYSTSFTEIAKYLR